MLPAPMELFKSLKYSTETPKILLKKTVHVHVHVQEGPSG